MDATNGHACKNDGPPFQSLATLLDEEVAYQVDSAIVVGRLEVGCTAFWQIGHVGIHSHGSADFAVGAVAYDTLDGSATIDDPV